MLDTINAILGSPFGSFSFVLGFLVLGGWLIHYATKFVTEYSVKHGQFNERMDKTESSIYKIQEDIAYIKGSFEAAVAIKDVLTRKKSPISITEFGLQVVADHNLDAMVDSNWSKINTSVQNMKANNPYDIQEFCLETAFVKPSVFFPDKDIDKLKLISFQTGIPLFSVARMMGVLIRDRYFKENGIDIAEIDKHRPQPDQGEAP